MIITIDGKNKKKISFCGSVKQLFAKLSLNKNIYLAARNGELLTEVDKLKDTDEIKLLKIISGG